jgi:hypothetical protein
MAGTVGIGWGNPKSEIRNSKSEPLEREPELELEPSFAYNTPLAQDDVISPVAALEAIESFKRALWEMVDSDASPFTAPAKPGTRERTAKELAATGELIAAILRRYYQ